MLAIVARGVVQFGCAYGKALSAGNRRRLKTTTASNNQNSAVLVTGGQPVGRTKAQVHVSEQSVIVWDLETVPDLAAAARLFDMGDATDAEVREALGTGFPKHPLHKIACIGALVASRQPEGWRVDALGAPHTGERSEAQLIRDFIEKIGQLRPQLITFNGHSFDLPVLRYRAMVNRVPAVGLQVRQYFHRYTEDALDLCDVLGSYVPGAKVKLDDVSKILGLSGKPVGIDGSRVEEMVLAGQIEEVARYCET